MSSNRFSHAPKIIPAPGICRKPPFDTMHPAPPPPDGTTCATAIQLLPLMTRTEPGSAQQFFWYDIGVQILPQICITITGTTHVHSITLDIMDGPCDNLNDIVQLTWSLFPQPETATVPTQTRLLFLVEMRMPPWPFTISWRPGQCIP